MPCIVTIRRTARKAVHTAFATPAVYADDTGASADVGVRWHNKLATYGDLEGSGFAEVVGHIERVIFDRECLAEDGVVPRRGGTLTLTCMDDQVLVLDTRDPYDGPVTEAWTVTRP